MRVAGRGNADRPTAIDILLTLDHEDGVAGRDRLDDLRQVIQDQGVDERLAAFVLSALDPSAVAVGPLNPKSFFAVPVVATDLAERERAVSGVVVVSRGKGGSATVGALLLAFLRSAPSAVMAIPGRALGIDLDGRHSFVWLVSLRLGEHSGHV